MGAISVQTEFLDGTQFWLEKRWWQSVVQTNHPSSEVFFFSCLSFIFLSMTGHLWCHASTGWAFLRHRSWCHRLSDLVYRTPGTFCDINEIPSGKDSDEREQPQAMCLKDKRVGCRVVALPCRTRLGGADITMLRARNVAFMCNCSHTHTRACYVLSRV